MSECWGWQPHQPSGPPPSLRRARGTASLDSLCCSQGKNQHRHMCEGGHNTSERLLFCSRLRPGTQVTACFEFPIVQCQWGKAKSSPRFNSPDGPCAPARWPLFRAATASLTGHSCSRRVASFSARLPEAAACEGRMLSLLGSGIVLSPATRPHQAPLYLAYVVFVKAHC